MKSTADVQLRDKVNILNRKRNASTLRRHFFLDSNEIITINVENESVHLSCQLESENVQKRSVKLNIKRKTYEKHFFLTSVVLLKEKKKF